MVLMIWACESPARPEPSAAPLESPSPTLGSVEIPVAIVSLEPESREPEAVAGTVDSQDLIPESRSTPEPSKQPIVVSTEVFTQTFSDVEKLIFLLNDIIKSRNYALWVEHLSAEYVRTMSDPAVLDEKNRSPTLKRLGVTLKSLQDYFSYVVVPSRANSRLDDLVFLSETEVEAIMVIGNRRVIVYKLVKIDGQWKIGLS